MKRIEFSAFGPPPEVCACVDAPELGAPGPGEVLVSVEACPINPVDLLTIEGRYASRPSTPAPIGSEGAGHVLAVGGGGARGPVRPTREDFAHPVRAGRRGQAFRLMRGEGRDCTPA